MARKKVLSIILITAAVVFAMQVVGLMFSLYWQNWWYDNIVHLFGGYFVGLSGLWFFFLSGYASFGLKGRINPGWILLTAVVFTIAAGAFWEIYEKILNTAYASEGYALDTIIDLSADLIGGLFAGVYFISKNYHLG